MKGSGGGAHNRINNWGPSRTRSGGPRNTIPTPTRQRGARPVFNMTPFDLLPAVLALVSLCLGAANSELLVFGPSSGDIDLGGHANSTELPVGSGPGFRIGRRVHKSMFVSRGRHKGLLSSQVAMYLLSLSRLQISRYGVVSFGSPLRPCCSDWSPDVSPQPVPFLAPLWTSGLAASVFYRTSLGEGDGERVRRRLVQAYDVQHFEPQMVLVVTWVDLPCCSAGNVGKQVSVHRIFIFIQACHVTCTLGLLSHVAPCIIKD